MATSAGCSEKPLGGGSILTESQMTGRTSSDKSGGKPDRSREQLVLMALGQARAECGLFRNIKTLQEGARRKPVPDDKESKALRFTIRDPV